MNGPPAEVVEPPRLEVVALGDDGEGIADVLELERTVLGFDRGRELDWLLAEREAYVYRRGGRPVAFAFVAKGRTGPIAALEPADLPAILDHVRHRAGAVGSREVSFEVPAPNVTAIRHLLGQGYRFDPFITFLMANRPFGRFDRFVGLTPPFVL